jgi:hypothetical protein
MTTMRLGVVILMALFVVCAAEDGWAQQMWSNFEMESYSLR